jgi:hypothetical protein
MSEIASGPGANPTTFEFTATTPALYPVGWRIFYSEKNIFVFETH